MSFRLLLGTLSLTVGASLVTSSAFAADVVRHSGPIVSENAKQDVITIAEMGPWHGPRTRPVRREFHLTPSTKAELAVRKNEPGAFKGEFAERSLKLTDLRIGDYATVSVEREGGATMATKVEVVRRGAGAGQSAQAPVEPHV